MIKITHTYLGNYSLPVQTLNMRKMGVPPGGPADTFLSTIATHLSESNTVLEIISPVTITATKPGQIVLAAPKNSLCIESNRNLSVAIIPMFPHTPLTICAPQAGYRAYVSWNGLKSIAQLPVMLASGQTFSFTPMKPMSLAFDVPDDYSIQKTISFLPISDQSTKSKQTPLNEIVIDGQVTPYISRIGTRLKTDPDNSSSFEREIIQKFVLPLARSEPSTFGAIQITPDQQILVHGPDGPTLGGYPKIGVVTQSDLPILAQLRPNQTVRLISTTIEKVQESRQIYQQKIKETLQKIDKALLIAREHP